MRVDRAELRRETRLLERAGRAEERDRLDREETELRLEERAAGCLDRADRRGVDRTDLWDEPLDRETRGLEDLAADERLADLPDEDRPPPRDRACSSRTKVNEKATDKTITPNCRHCFRF